MRTVSLLLAFVLASPGVAHAEGPGSPSIELNILWPFFPGGITELRGVIPLVRTEKDSGRGALVTGVYSDYASKVVRDDSYGKVSSTMVKLGWRQYFVHGLHVEVAVNTGWRHEAQRPPMDETFDGFQARAWINPGYELDFTPRFYGNVRGALGVNIIRTGPHGDEEKRIVGGGDLNLGVRF